MSVVNTEAAGIAAAHTGALALARMGRPRFLGGTEAIPRDMLAIRRIGVQTDAALQNPRARGFQPDALAFRAPHYREHTRPAIHP
ncbi:hypothetical protein D7U70_16775 [Pseudomonas balearica]|nr:hypothetical protein [Stutzerimonas balearica]